MKDWIAELLGIKRYKRCIHGATSWYVCTKCKKEHPEWKPFEGEGTYNPNL